MTRYYMLFSLIILLSFSVYGTEEKARTLSGGARLYFETDFVEMTDSEYQAGILGYLSVSPDESWRFTLQADMGTDTFRLDELWGEYSYHKNSRIRFGIFENGILMEDASGVETLFADDSYIRTRLSEMSWYSDNSAGSRYSREWEDLRTTAEFFFFSNSSEILIRGDINKSLGPGRMGATLVYHPYLFHNMWSEEESSSHWSSDRIFTFGNVDPRGIYEIHYLLLDLYWGDLSGERDWIYKSEVTAGNNLPDPLGYLEYPADESCSFFLSGDFLLGRVLCSGDFSWTPSLNLSGYMEDLEEPNIGTIVIRTGNRWSWNESLAIFLDAGFEIRNYYLQEESGETLMTGIDGILSAKAQYRF